jgi:hypothetical protein
MPLFMKAEWHPPEDLSEFDVCDCCMNPTRDLVIIAGRQGHFAICTGCSLVLARFARQVADEYLRLDEQYRENVG